MTNPSGSAMPLVQVCAFVAAGIALLLFGLTTEGSAGVGLTSGGLGLITVTGILAVAGRVRR